MTALIRSVTFLLVVIPLARGEDVLAAPRAPLTMAQVLVWMDGGAESLRVAQLVERQGIDFAPDAELLSSLASMHAKTALLEKLKQAKIILIARDPAKEQAAYSQLLACLQKSSVGTNQSVENSCTKAETNEASTARFASGLLALHRRNLDEALRLFKAAVDADRKVPDLHNYLGLTYRDLHDLEEAEMELREAMRLDPEYETPVSNLAYLYLQRDDLVRAEEYARQAIGLMHEDASAHNNLGLALIKEQKASEGIQELFEAERLEPQVPFRHMQIAEVFVIAKKYEDALREYRQADALDPQNATIHQNILKMLVYLRRHDEAVSECESLNTLTPTHSHETCKDFVRRVIGK
jgi:Flp pilus assembly protein TadD